MRIFVSQDHAVNCREPELALQFGGRDALLRRGDLEDGAEPKGERLLALCEDRPGDHRDLPAAVGALVDHPLRRQEVGSVTRAVGAAEALRPFQPSEVLSAVVFIGEPTSELGLAARKAGQVHPAPDHLCSPYVLIPLTR